MFLMVSYMFQKYATLAYDIYDGCLCHIWRCLVSYMTLTYALLDDEFNRTVSAVFGTSFSFPPF